MEVNEQIAIDHGLKKDEYKKICDLLKRTPNLTELGIFSAMWNEHCSYKSSRIHLKKLPTKGKKVIQGPGENAGVIDIEDGDAIVFKMESHNHPSFIEPYQGAATGVGGIMRDVFTMGARPIANLNSLRFGDPKNRKTKNLLRGVVKGIGDYGNCVGIPTVGGECFFHETATIWTWPLPLSRQFTWTFHPFRWGVVGESRDPNICRSWLSFHLPVRPFVDRR